MVSGKPQHIGFSIYRIFYIEDDETERRMDEALKEAKKVGSI